MRVLIIGGTGFISTYVVRHLNNMGHEITLFHRGQTEAELPPGVQHLLGNRQNLPDFADLFKHLAPHVVLDMTPASEHDAQNVVSTFKCIAHRLVAISSQDVYRAYGRLIRTEPGSLELVPLAENAPLRQKFYPLRGVLEWAHDYDKILVEQVAKNDPNLPATILRLPGVYGPGDPQHRLFNYVKRMDDNRPIILLDEARARWHWTRGYVENVAAAIALAVVDERATGQTYNVGEPEALSEAELVRRIGQAAGWNGRVIAAPKDRLPSHLVESDNTAQDFVADTTKIRKELGYNEPVLRDEAFRQTITWERTHPPTKVDPNAFDYKTEDTILAELECSGS